MTFTTVLFYILAFVLVIAAFRVITARSPVTAVLHLILAFANAAMIWMLLGAEFLALLLVLVYVGAVMVLFLFVVMMLDIRIDSLRDGLKTYLPLGLVIGVVLVLEMAFVLGSTWYGAGPQAPVAGDYNNARALGEVMYTQYVYAIEVGAALLLVGMVAAIALTLRRRRDAKVQRPGRRRARARERPLPHGEDDRAERPCPGSRGLAVRGCPRRTTMTLTLAHYLILGAILFAIGIFGIFLNRRNLIILLMSIELVLLAVNMNFVAFSSWFGDIAGQVFVFFILTVAAAEAAIGLAILVLLFRNLNTINVDELDRLKG